MNNVREAPLVSGQPATPRPIAAIRPAAGGCALGIGRLGLWLAVIAFGGVAWAINGGYSVIGLGVIAGSFNDAGRLFWDLATTIQFRLPVRGGVLLPLVLESRLRLGLWTFCCVPLVKNKQRGSQKIHSVSSRDSAKSRNRSPVHRPERHSLTA